MSNEEKTSKETIPRDFKGVWIPRKIWDNPELDLFEKCVWAFVSSLHDPDKIFTISRSIACKFLNCSYRRLEKTLVKLNNIGVFPIGGE